MVVSLSKLEAKSQARFSFCNICLISRTYITKSLQNSRVCSLGRGNTIVNSLSTRAGWDDNTMTLSDSITASGILCVTKMTVGLNNSHIANN